MKKILTMLITLALVLTLSACGGTASTQSSSIPPAEDSIPEVSSINSSASDTATLPDNVDQLTEENKILVAYFSKTGNTKSVGDVIVASVGGDALHIQPQTPYPEDYNKTTVIAKEEQNANARPALAEIDIAVEDYDIIFLGYPIWWGTLPMSMFTFLESYDLSGKTIIPFATHAGSGLGRGPDDIAKLCPDATLLKGLAIPGSSVGGAKADIEVWVDSLEILQEKITAE